MNNKIKDLIFVLYLIMLNILIVIVFHREDDLFTLSDLTGQTIRNNIINCTY